MRWNTDEWMDALSEISSRHVEETLNEEGRGEKKAGRTNRFRPLFKILAAAAAVLLIILIPLQNILHEQGPEAAETLPTADLEQTESDTRPEQHATQVSGEQIQDDHETVTLNWLLPDFEQYGLLADENVKLLNEKLLEDGYDFQLSITEWSFDAKYTEDRYKALTVNESDIVSWGVNVEGEYPDIAGLLRSSGAAFLELSSYLAGEEGAALYEAMSEDEWKSVEIDGKIFSIPNQSGTPVAGYLAFNRAYFTEEELEGVGFDMNALYALLESKNLSDVAYPLIWRLGLSEIAPQGGYIYAYGAFIDCETGGCYNPFETETLREIMAGLNMMMESGYMGNGSKGYFLTEDEEDKVISERQFAVLADSRRDGIYEDMLEDVILVPLSFAVSSRIAGSTAVFSTSTHQKEALTLLTLLYTDPVYANLLWYGQEGTDYQLIDGQVCDMSGEVWSDNPLKQAILGFYDQILPRQGDDFPTDRAVSRRELYDSSYKIENPFLGFQLDRSVQIMEEYYENGWLFETQAQKIYEEFIKQDDISAYLNCQAEELNTKGFEEFAGELSGQIAEWRGNYGE